MVQILVGVGVLLLLIWGIVGIGGMIWQGLGRIVEKIADGPVARYDKRKEEEFWRTVDDQKS